MTGQFSEKTTSIIFRVINTQRQISCFYYNIREFQLLRYFFVTKTKKLLTKLIHVTKMVPHLATCIISLLSLSDHHHVFLLLLKNMFGFFLFFLPCKSHSLLKIIPFYYYSFIFSFIFCITDLLFLASFPSFFAARHVLIRFHLKLRPLSLYLHHDIKPQSLHIHNDSSPSDHLLGAARIVVTGSSFSDAALFGRESSMSNNSHFWIYFISGPSTFDYIHFCPQNFLFENISLSN